MKHLLKTLPIISLVLFYGCEAEDSSQTMHFATSAQYPPFEYIQQGQLKGFDIDLANLIAQTLGKKAIFDDMQFSSVLPAVTSGQDDAAIATITITDTRKNNMDFSNPYYFEGMAVVYQQSHPIQSINAMKTQHMAAQLGSVMDLWLKKNLPAQAMTSFNTNNQAIEALLSGQVDGILMDGAQGAIFSQKHPGLGYAIVMQSEEGYGIALKKGSPLQQPINNALEKLKANGQLEQLKKKWFGAA